LSLHTKNLQKMGFISEFKEFAVKGNVMDLAVGVIIGGAFGKIIDSVINDLVMPIVAGIVGQPDFSNMYYAFKDTPVGTSLADAKKLGPVFAYGNFITVLINFILLALVIFMMVKAMNKMKKAEAAAEPAGPSSTDVLLMEIRDALKK
jgi:large conductance mechanosensitive channel